MSRTRKVTKMQFKSQEDAISQLKSAGYKTIRNVYWYIPGKHIWAYLSADSKVRFFQNMLQENGKRKAVEFKPEFPEQQRKRQRKQKITQIAA